MTERTGMEILFTTTDSIASRFIRDITGEPVSHCVVRVGEFVIHSSFKGVVIEPYDLFRKNNKILYRILGLTYPSKIRRTLSKYYGKMYDYPALLYLGLRYLLPSIVPKQNLWQTTGMFICTEFITQLLEEKEDSMITPYKLYLRLKPLDGRL